MITRVRLSNWRAYDELDLELKTGTTFVVAPNGIGKTSIVEAAAWALFADHVPAPRGPVRAGAENATASVEVVLPDMRTLRVERTMPRRAASRVLRPTVHMDDVALSADSLDSVLRAAYGAEPAFLARIAMPQWSAASDVPEGWKLREHLCRLFGVENLSAALVDIDARLRESDKSIKAAKQGQRLDDTRLAELHARVATSASHLEAARAAHDRARTEVADADAEQRSVELRREWQVRYDHWHAALADVASQAAGLIGHIPEPEDAPAALASAAAAVREELQTTVRSLGAHDASAAALDVARRELDHASGECPVCKRPLDELTIDNARRTHDKDLQVLRRLGSGLTRTEKRLRTSLAALERLSVSAANAPAPGPPPQTPDRPLGDEISPRTQPALNEVLTPEQLREAEALAMGTLVEATAAHRNAQVALDHATRDLGAHEALVRLFATDALLRGARATIDQTIGTFVDETIGPIAAELGPRWSTLFPGRGRPYLDGDGSVTRPVNGEGLPFESFSGGERVGALLLLRLLVAQMTTTLTFCWFDEPLEHLDPDTRRQVAGLLSGASRSHPLRQIVLTTYEESLAARLAADSPDEVDLLAVRSAR